MALLKRALFGSRRERFRGDDPNQQYLFDSKEVPAEEASPEPESGRPGGPASSHEQGAWSPRFSRHLPRKTVRHELNEEDVPEDLRDDPAAKRFFKKTSEELEYVPPSVYVIEHYQEVIVRDDETGETTMATARKAAAVDRRLHGPRVLVLPDGQPFCGPPALLSARGHSFPLRDSGSGEAPRPVGWPAWPKASGRWST